MADGPEGKQDGKHAAGAEGVVAPIGQDLVARAKTGRVLQQRPHQRPGHERGVYCLLRRRCIMACMRAGGASMLSKAGPMFTWRSG